MLPLSLGLPLAIISLVGFLVNAYIVLVVVLTKQVRISIVLYQVFVSAGVCRERRLSALTFDRSHWVASSHST